MIASRFHALLWAACIAMAGGAYAQDAGKPLRIIQGFAPGGGHDTVARLLAPRTGSQLGVNAIVEARPGANGMIGAEVVAKSAPDGNTIFLSGVSTFVLNPLVYSKVAYDTLKDFAPITLVAALPQIIVAHPRLPAKSLNEVAQLARRNPNQLSAGSPGVGGLSHLTLELFKRIAKLDIEHVPYKGTGAALVDVLGGYVPVIIGDLPGPLPHVKAGKLRALAVTSGQRSSLLPDVPTASEQGYRELESTNWYGVMAPSGVPPQTVTRIHAALVAAAQAPETRERYAALGMDPAVSASPGAFTTFVRDEFTRWNKVVRSTGIKLEQQ
ncbi:MAG: tripartite tricarboxylate transporter substrate binding protein [Burkholderiales bacterium]|nr:tripartite tricarboxylate transporter substrate binding protein [Burkholderiales bacterium]